MENNLLPAATNSPYLASSYAFVLDPFLSHAFALNEEAATKQLTCVFWCHPYPRWVAFNRFPSSSAGMTWDYLETIWVASLRQNFFVILMMMANYVLRMPMCATDQLVQCAAKHDAVPHFGMILALKRLLQSTFFCSTDPHKTVMFDNGPRNIL